MSPHAPQHTPKATGVGRGGGGPLFPLAPRDHDQDLLASGMSAGVLLDHQILVVGCGLKTVLQIEGPT